VEGQTGHNPLAQYYRQPKIYIKLPSNGEFYPEGALDKSVNEEYPVYAMTAKDELLLKTPDALLNGQSTVDVIKSCVPAILDPWKMPVIDVDAVLIAIRIATYGNEMDVTHICKGCESEADYVVDLTDSLGHIQSMRYETRVDHPPLIIHLHPYSYKDMTTVALKAFEQQRVLKIVSDQNMEETEKLQKFNESFNKLTQFTIDTITSSITSIETPEGVVTNSEMINDFINNTSKDIFESIQTHVNDFRDKSVLPTQKIQCEKCSEIAEVSISMDMSNFFAVRS